AAGAFHGRTLGSLAATPRRPYQEGFGPLPGGFDSVEYGNAEALERALDDTVAAFLVEPVQGEGGIVLPPPGYLRQARRLTRERGALLIVDEVQCGMGRTGHLFAFQAEGVRPDIITLAKGLGGGLPIGAVAATLEVARSFQPGDHGCTFGANPVCCAAALAVLRILQREDLPGRAGRLGQVFAARLGPLAGSLPWVREVRCRGLMIGIELDRPAAEALERLRREGLLANACGPVLRLLPPLNLSDAELEEGLEILERVLGSLDS
ncbi:MAG TPA: aminotransferase class III-fold pyridoxal phosphate-dependent enzyme, partial [Candidatus Nitrosotenuis sp.]|nr:aminotransferase class III-fold pyridoxal phosphate-dependent enzyme [Candidatus Nitrosotenuis sp.]